MSEKLESETPSYAAACSAPADWPVETRISHRIILYSAQCKPHAMNQYTLEDIVREEIAREQNVRPLAPADNQTSTTQENS